MRGNIRELEYEVDQSLSIGDRTTAKPALSIVVPVFNESGNIQPLLDAIDSVFAGLEQEISDYQLLLVDDGSRDSTWVEINSLGANRPYLRALRLSRNFGHQNALLAGLANSDGDIIVTMDGDLQHPPEVIAQLVREWRAGFDVVSTERIDVQESSYFKRKTSQLFYKLFSRLTEVHLSQGTSDFRLLDRKVLDALLKFDDVRMFFRGAVSWVGFSTTTVPYRLKPRHSGSTKYSLSRMLKFAGSAIISFSTVPLKIGIVLGFVTSLLAFAELTWVLVQFSRGITVPGWASTIGILSLLFGVLFVMLGIVGLYVSRIHEALQRRPRYLVSETSSEHVIHDR